MASVALKRHHAPGGLWQVYDGVSAKIAKFVNKNVRSLVKRRWRRALLFAHAVAGFWKEHSNWEYKVVIVSSRVLQ